MGGVLEELFKNRLEIESCGNFGFTVHLKTEILVQVFLGFGKTVSAAWRQVGKNVSIAYELPCPGDGLCASLILQGRVKGGGVLIKRGSVIVVWDTTNSRNPALYDTSNGSFRGDHIE